MSGPSPRETSPSQYHHVSPCLARDMPILSFRSQGAHAPIELISYIHFDTRRICGVIDVATLNLPSVLMQWAEGGRVAVVFVSRFFDVMLIALCFDT